MLQITPISAFKDNYIWLVRRVKLSYCIVVDPGDAIPVLDYLAKEQLQLAAILLTHHHADHCGGVSALLEHFVVPVYGSAREKITTVTHTVQHNANVFIPELNCQFTVIEIPGHTLGHIAYYGEEVLFSGDTLFLAGCGRLFEGTAEQMHHSLSRLATLAENTQIYCGHEYTLANLAFAKTVEPENLFITERINTVKKLRDSGQPSIPASLEVEKASNPFLRCHLPQVKHAAEQFSGEILTTPVEVFKVIRQWKDNFK